MSPEATVGTRNSSIQPSPEPSRGRSHDDAALPTPLSLPESVLARKTSYSAMNYAASMEFQPPSMSRESPGNLFRRLSNKTRLVGRRRQSSATPITREGSVGPAMVRKRSGSTTTVPAEMGNPIALATDSDESLDDKEERDRDGISSLGLNVSALGLNVSSISANGATSPSATMDGPVYPPQVLSGAWVRKVSRKNRNKRILMVLEPGAGRITWTSTSSRKIKSIRVDHIKDLRMDSDIRQYCRDFEIPESEEKRWFSILYAAPELHKTKTMHLIAEDMGAFKNWTAALARIWQHRLDNLISLMSFDDKAIQEYWNKEVALQCDGESPYRHDGSEGLDFRGFERVCRHLHINPSRKQLLERFQHATSMPHAGRMDFAKFREFIGYIKTRKDIAEIYKTVAPDPARALDFGEFLAVLRRVQGEEVDGHEGKWRTVFLEYADGSSSEKGSESERGESTTMSDAGLARFFTSGYNAPMIEAPADYLLDRPMNEYFISSSHNTYLTGRQMVDESSIEGYITALSEGCRCVEVDCWDGSDGQPVVLHGRAMTSSISFQEVMTTIKKYAFVRSKYPLWISLEVHTNALQQARMATIIKETFGPALVTEPLDPTSDKMPSPSELEGRILIKVKKPQAKEDATGRRRGNSLTSPYTKPLVVDNRDVPSQSLPQTPILSPSHSARRLGLKLRVNTIAEGEIDGQSSSSSSSGSDAETESLGDLQLSGRFDAMHISERILGQKLDSPAEPPVADTLPEPVLGDLGVYCAGVRFSGFDAPEAKTFNHIFSFMESSFARFSRTKKYKKLMDRHNMRYLMRVYPNQTRINSSNYDPLMYWRRGVQMAALNWQRFDHGMQLNRAMFEGGPDSSGYVLKPSELRQIQVLKEGWSGKRERKIVRFSIDIISAQKLMRPTGMPPGKEVHPYVEVEVFHDKRFKSETERSLLGGDPDMPYLQRTQVVPANGFDPNFNRTFNFKVTTKYPDLVFVKWSVKLSNDGETISEKAPAIATFTAKLSNLKEGYRTLPLYNRIGELYVFSTLFCRIQKQDVETVLLECPEDTRRDDEPPSSGKILGLGRFRGGNSPKSSVEKVSVEAT